MRLSLELSAGHSARRRRLLGPGDPGCGRGGRIVRSVPIISIDIVVGAAPVIPAAAAAAALVVVEFGLGQGVVGRQGADQQAGLLVGVLSETAQRVIERGVVRRPPLAPGLIAALVGVAVVVVVLVGHHDLYMCRVMCVRDVLVEGNVSQRTNAK